ncbi:MAG: hypothetical protein JWO95_300 [Verrucomicrobiales bacterium]|nr:hypothetical protein [Verrucomicrobiales bacterium]
MLLSPSIKWFALQQQRRRRRNRLNTGNSILPNVPADCVLRLSAGDLGASEGDTVPWWPDSSGNGSDAWQDAEANQPTFYVVDFAGKTFPILQFDADDDGMATPVVITGAFSIFTLWRPNNLSQTAIISSGSLDWSMGTNGGGMLCYFTDWSAGGTVNTNDFFLFEARIIPGEQPTAIYLNGTQAALVHDGGSSAPQQVTLGTSGLNGYPADCDCAEILIYDRFLSDEEAAGVRAYFQQQYNYLKQ